MYPADCPLGKTSTYPEQYAPDLLFAIPRLQWPGRTEKDLELPYQGADVWTCYELSWLLPSGKPAVAVAYCTVPVSSPNIIESKSFKLYLNSFNQSVFVDRTAVQNVLVRDLSDCAGALVAVQVVDLAEAQGQGITALPGVCIDGLEISCSQYAAPNIGLLSANVHQQVSQVLHSHLLRSLCPVTQQPDWGSICIAYQGAQLDHASFLAYLVSFRQHADFHEHCVERIFLDLQSVLQPTQLTVYARYLRRGGIDINPWRSTHAQAVVQGRLVRQ